MSPKIPIPQAQKIVRSAVPSRHQHEALEKAGLLHKKFPIPDWKLRRGMETLKKEGLLKDVPRYQYTKGYVESERKKLAKEAAAREKIKPAGLTEEEQEGKIRAGRQLDESLAGAKGGREALHSASQNVDAIHSVKQGGEIKPAAEKPSEPIGLPIVD